MPAAHPEPDIDQERAASRPSHRRRALPGSSVAASHSPNWDERHWTSRLLNRVGELTAHSAAGVLVAAIVLVWVVVGLFYGFPTWWSTAFYTGTASMTLVMVFAIQHTSERQTSAIQRKLDELIRSSVQADDSLIAVEEASDGHLQALTDVNIATGQQMRD